MSKNRINPEELITAHLEHFMGQYQKQLFCRRELGTIEHIVIGDNIITTLVDAIPNQVRIRQNFTLSYGEIMGLAGDYYGTPEELRMDSEADLKAILDLNGPTSAGGVQFKAWLRDIIKNKPRFLKLAYWNFDHFQPDAQSCYQIYHQRALETAREAALLAQRLYGKPLQVQAYRRGEEKNADFQDELLTGKVQEAYFLNGFADHFLTDCFASGHIRVPRKELHYENPALGGLRGKEMHDEENKAGLWVNCTKYPNPWLAWGDNEVLADKAQCHREKIGEAVKESLLDIASVLKGENPPQRWEALIPKPVAWQNGMKPDSSAWQDQHPGSNPVNYEPMYRVEDGVVKTRR